MCDRKSNTAENSVIHSLFELDAERHTVKLPRVRASPSVGNDNWPKDKLKSSQVCVCR